MLSYFPTPYPDELLYSTITRYHIRSGNLTFNQTLLELLGYSPQQFFNLDLPNNLDYLVKRLPAASTHCSETFIQEHTLYPFYKSFLKAPEAWMLKNRMQKKLGDPIFAIAKVSKLSKGGSRRFLRYCPVCSQQDIEKYGELYWHRMHQVPGVLICLTHRTILQESLVLVEEGYQDCHAADTKNCPICTENIAYREDTIQKLVAIAQDIAWLSNSSIDFKGLQWLRNRYEQYLIEQEFVCITPSKNIKFDKQKFAESIFNFYGQEFWGAIEPDLQTQTANYFTHCLFACDIAPVIDRTMFIVLIRFLSNSLKEFFEE